jgi:phosphotransferase system HPr (HPr) family protein
LLVKTLQPYKCRIEIRAGREVANGQSIIGLMALAAGTGSEVSFTISGEDAARAMAAVSRVFEDRFGERHGSSGDSDECSQRRSGDSEARC